MLLGLHVQATAQLSSVRFRQYHAEDGLSHGSIYSLMEDHQGYIWMGTADGLNRFDGHEFEVFRHDPREPQGLSTSSYFMTMMEDSHGNVWIGTSRKSANIYHRSSERFIALPHIPSYPKESQPYFIRDFLEDVSGRIWMATSQELMYAEHYDPSMPDSVSWALFDCPGDRPFHCPIDIYDLEIAPNNRMWIGTTNGLGLLDPAKGSFHLYSSESNPQTGPSALKIVHEILPDPDGESLWIATDTYGLLRLWFDDLEQDFPQLVRHQQYVATQKQGKTSITNNRMLALAMDKEGNLWVGTGFGLNQYHRDSDSFTYHLHKDGSSSTISQDYIRSMCFSETGDLWLGTDVGLTLLPSKQKPFHLYYQELIDVGKRQNTTPHSYFLDEQSQTLWVGTSGGLNKIDRKSGKRVRHYYDLLDPAKLTYPFVKNLFKGYDGKLWAMTATALQPYDQATNTFQREVFWEESRNYGGSGAKPGRTYWSVWPESDSMYWLGANEGLVRFNPQTKEEDLFPMEPKRAVITIHRKLDGKLWIGTAHGMFLFDEELEAFELFEGYTPESRILLKTNVKDFHRSRDGIFWIASLSGLYRIDESAQTIRNYDRYSGLSNSGIRSIEEDAQGRLWLGSLDGLICFDPKTESSQTYTVGDGLQAREFYTRSSYVSPSGEMFFGGGRGFNYFHPDSIRPNPNLPNVHVTGLKLFNTPVPVGQADTSRNLRGFFLPQSISQLPEISLTYQHRVFTLEFTAIEFTQPDENQLAYQLEGFDPDWTYCGNCRSATYTNLDPGSYTFRVKASNNDGVWNEEGTSILITISPPWWKTLWAYGLYVLLAIAAIYGIIRLRTQEIRRELAVKARLQQAKMEERENTRSEASRDFHDEAGNKITKLSLYTGLLQRQLSANEQALDYLESIQKNIRDLSGGMRDFIWVLDPKQDDLRSTLSRIRDFGAGLFQDSEIAFQYEEDFSGPEPERLPVKTKRHLLMICKEAMHNALKYAQCSSFQMKVEQVGGQLFIHLTDDGLGFNTPDQSKGYGLGNMKARAKEIGGSLDIHSQPGMGTRIVLGFAVSC